MSKRILIIDDEQHIRRMMRITLEAAGYEVAEAQDGREGLNLYAEGSSWDGVILDQRMPGIDGLEVLTRIKSANPRACVVMATAYASIELAVDAMKLGASDFVRKPMTPEILRNAVSASLAKTHDQASYDTAEARSELASAQTFASITMNGFSIIDPDKDEPGLPDQRCFGVISPSGNRHEILVQIDEEVLGYVERLTHRRLPPESSFWTEQARHLLADYLWNEGDVPRTSRLTLTEMGRDSVLVAERWRDH
jgi:CheY-like chemotaxis protein